MAILNHIFRYFRGSVHTLHCIQGVDESEKMEAYFWPGLISIAMTGDPLLNIRFHTADQ